MSNEFSHIDGVQELPPQMLEPWGMGFVIRAKVDAVTEVWDSRHTHPVDVRVEQDVTP